MTVPSKKTRTAICDAIDSKASFDAQTYFNHAHNGQLAVSEMYELIAVNHDGTRLGIQRTTDFAKHAQAVCLIEECRKNGTAAERERIANTNDITQERPAQKFSQSVG